MDLPCTYLSLSPGRMNNFDFDFAMAPAVQSNMLDDHKPELQADEMSSIQFDPS